MSNPGQFRDFNKKTNDLLTRVFPKKTSENSWGVEAALAPTPYFKGGLKLNNVAGVSTGEGNVEVEFEDFGICFKETVKTDKPTVQASWKMSDKIPVDGLTVGLHFDATDESQTAGFSVAFEQEFITLNGRVKVPVATAFLDFVKQEAIQSQDTKLDIDFVTTHTDYNFFLGGLAKVAFPAEGDRRVDEAQVSAGWRDGSLNAVLNFTQKHKDGSDTKSLGLSTSTKPADTTYAFGIDYSLDTKAASATLGLEYPLSDGATVKAKMNSNKVVGFSYVNKVSDATTLSFGTLCAISTEDKLSVASSFSFNLKFTQ